MNLDELRAAIEAKFKPFELEASADVKATFAPYLRLTSEARAVLIAAQNELVRVSEDKTSTPEQDETDIKAAITSALRAAGSGNVDGVITALGDDAATLMTVWEEYRKAASGNS